MYLKHFGLREAPFNLTPDPKFFFDSPLHREAWAALFYGIKQKKGFVVVTGEVGTGKTTLVRKLLRSLEATQRSVFIFNTLLSFDELLEAILRDLELESIASGRIGMLDQLNDFLLDQLKEGHVVSVILDEAQNLNEDALEAVRLLSNMETDREKLLQIILVGQPELVAKLDSRSLRQLKQRISLWCRLESLSLADTDAYVRHRLKVAGYDGPDLFDAATIPCIWERTSGIPRLINAVCDNALLTAFASSQKIVSLDIVQDVVRDLRIKSETETVEAMMPGKDLAQPPRKGIGDAAELREEKMGVKIRWSEDQGRSRFARSTPAMAAAESVPNLPRLEPDRDETAALELLKRQQIRTVANVAEFKEKENAGKGRMVEIAEDIWPSRTVSANGNGFAGKTRNFDNRRNDTTTPAAFFEKMAAALTEAMGPMARLVIKGQVALMDESVERFPIVRLHELIQRIKGEILNEALRTAFENEIIKEIEHQTKSSIWRYSSR